MKSELIRSTQTVRTEGFAYLDYRTGYGVFFLERQQLLQILYDNIRDKSAVLVDHRVNKIDNFDDCALVQTRDGQRFKCQLVVGADGVHSTVRQEIEKMSTPDRNGRECLLVSFEP